MKIELRRLPNPRATNRRPWHARAARSEYAAGQTYRVDWVTNGDGRPMILSPHKELYANQETFWSLWEQA